MTLQTKLVALVSAIGADIKQLQNNSGNGANETAPEPDSIYRLYPDSDYVCRLVETRYANGAASSRSWLGGYTNGQYTKLTEAFFAKDGYSLLRLNLFDITYYPGTSVVKSQTINITRDVGVAANYRLFNDVVRVKSQTPDEIWTNYTEQEDKAVFNGTSAEMGITAIPFTAGTQYAEFYFDSSNTKHAIIGIAPSSFDIQTGVIGSNGSNSASYDTLTGNLSYNGQVFATAAVPMGVTNCTYCFNIDTSANKVTVHHVAGTTVTTVIDVTLPMSFEGCYFVFSGKDSYNRTKFRCNYGDYDWARAGSFNGAFNTFK